MKRIFALTLLLSLCACSATQTQDSVVVEETSSEVVKETPKESEFLAEKDWPRSCDEAVDWLIEALGESSKIKIKETPREALIRYHHGLGRAIRNNFGLWRENYELLESCMQIRPHQDFHPDTVSMIIIEKTWEKLNE